MDPGVASCEKPRSGDRTFAASRLADHQVASIPWAVAHGYLLAPLRGSNPTINHCSELLIYKSHRDSLIAFMKAKRIIRANHKLRPARDRERAVRDNLQAEKPSLDDLLRSGDCDSEAVMTMGMYFDIQAAIQALKLERTRRGLSIGDVADRSGLDRAVISRLENGKQDNPTVATLMRYAAAIGKRFVWSFEELSKRPTARSRKATARRA